MSVTVIWQTDVCAMMCHKVQPSIVFCGVVRKHPSVITAQHLIYTLTPYSRSFNSHSVKSNKKFTAPPFISYRIATLIGYDPEEVIGKTAYQFHNPLDAKLVGDCHQKCEHCLICFKLFLLLSNQTYRILDALEKVLSGGLSLNYKKNLKNLIFKVFLFI